MKAPFERAIESDSPVLVLGPVAAERELIARTIHVNGSRADRRFLRIPCEALPPDLLASELFGSMPGAPSSPVRHGLFEMVAGGMLFLDEIARCSVDVQIRLVRALQDREIVRVGAREAIAIDMRLIAGAAGICSARSRRAVLIAIFASGSTASRFVCRPRWMLGEPRSSPGVQ